MRADLAVGVDVVLVADVERSLVELGQRYLDRCFTPDEVEAATSSGPLAAGLAGRFAAKEAVYKALRPADAAVEWRTIEIVRRPSGACEVRLHGPSADLARSLGVVEIVVSLSHEGPTAVAVAIVRRRRRRRLGRARLRDLA